MPSHLKPSSAAMGVRREICTDYVCADLTMCRPRAGEGDSVLVQEVASDLVQPAAAGWNLFVPFGSARVPRFYERFGKRLLDVVASVLLGVLLLPLLLAIGIALKVTMGSPVVFRQQRVGWNGKVFTILKFRTMLPDRRRCSAGYQGLERRKIHKSLNDPRVTNLGRFLRKWSLDELPQLWNVLRGDMSLVGPRPELIMIVKSYEPWQHQRHAVKPGLTGLWQVSRRGDGLMHEHIDLDLKYINNLSFQTDLHIIFNTVTAVLGKTHGF
jgi:lipopolysaccharide/colanic/teichoic acid biosynthesis glycosyltransferase